MFLMRSIVLANLFLGAPVVARAGAACAIPNAILAAVQAQLQVVVNLPDGNGGLFKPNRMWSAIVDRQGVLCSVKTTAEFAPSLDVWPGSRAIAIAKAGTANDFSNNALALSTANLYGPTQPGGSLYGLNSLNALNPTDLDLSKRMTGDAASGIITFGGGVALYVEGNVIGALGVSGDSSCADHAVAFRMRQLAGLNGVPSGMAPDNSDNIMYANPGTAPTGYQQPHCFPSDLTPEQIEQIPPH